MSSNQQLMHEGHHGDRHPHPCRFDVPVATLTRTNRSTIALKWPAGELIDPQTITLTHTINAVKLGRQKSKVDVLIDDLTVSKEHCILQVSKGREWKFSRDALDAFSGRGFLWIQDCESTNGTFVNGTLAASPAQLLHHGDLVCLTKESSNEICEFKVQYYKEQSVQDSRDDPPSDETWPATELLSSDDESSLNRRTTSATSSAISQVKIPQKLQQTSSNSMVTAYSHNSRSRSRGQKREACSTKAPLDNQPEDTLCVTLKYEFGTGLRIGLQPSLPY